MIRLWRKLVDWLKGEPKLDIRPRRPPTIEGSGTRVISKKEVKELLRSKKDGSN